MAQKTVVSMPAVARTAPGRGCRKDKMPLGTVVIRERNKGNRTHLARYVKVRDDGPKGRRWILYARWWWEEHRGPVPAGHLVLHKDGDELNDDPENLVVGTNGTKLQIAHRRDPAWSKKQHERAAAGTGNFNRFAGKLNRLKEILKAYWYPVLDSYGVILNVPFRRLKPLLAWFHADVEFYPKNGRAKKYLKRAIYETGVRPVRGQDLAHEYYGEYVSLDPEFGVGSGPARSRSIVEEKIAKLENTPIWKRAQEAAQLDLRKRD